MWIAIFPPGHPAPWMVSEREVQEKSSGYCTRFWLMSYPVMPPETKIEGGTRSCAGALVAVPTRARRPARIPSSGRWMLLGRRLPARTGREFRGILVDIFVLL